MKEQYFKAFAEVEQIIMLMPKGLQDKIPEKFKNLLSTWKDPNYIVNIEEPFEECNIMEETKIVLAVIYRDFLCSKEEKREIQLKDSEKLKEYEEELRQKYNPDDIFKNKKNNQIVIEETKPEETAMVEYKEKNFLQKIFDKIKHLFKKN